ncbi:MAG: PspC domain-containing protein [Terriglobia bacterium]
MICPQCQREIADYSNYCYYCGSRQSRPGSARAGRRLMRSATDQKIAGVCAGFAEYFNLDPTIVRLVWAMSIFIPPLCVAAILGYIAAWIVMPVAPLPAPVGAEKPAEQRAP